MNVAKHDPLSWKINLPLLFNQGITRGQMPMIQIAVPHIEKISIVAITLIQY